MYISNWRTYWSVIYQQVGLIYVFVLITPTSAMSVEEYCTYVIIYDM